MLKTALSAPPRNTTSVWLRGYEVRMEAASTAVEAKMGALGAEAIPKGHHSAGGVWRFESVSLRTALCDRALLRPIRSDDVSNVACVRGVGRFLRGAHRTARKRI